MCGGLEYEFFDPAKQQWVLRKSYFPIPKAQIPVITENGVQLMQWGKRKGEDLEIDVPVTGWARILSLKEGKWSAYHPKRVRVQARQWMEKDSDRKSHWFPLNSQEYLLGVQIEKAGQNFVYIVTHPASGGLRDVHERMPYIVSE